MLEPQETNSGGLMDEHRDPSPAEARASLEHVEESRQAAVKATRRSVWIDLGMALVIGTGIALGLAGQGIAAVVVFTVGCAAVVLAERALVRRQGRVFDQRALGARAWRFALLYLVLFLLTMVDPPADGQPWFAVGVGAVAGAGGFSWLRWEDRYQGQRLASGDYDRYDLL